MVPLSLSAALLGLLFLFSSEGARRFVKGDLSLVLHFTLYFALSCVTFTLAQCLLLLHLISCLHIVILIIQCD